ncbi:hypothetical protein [Corynebacterium sp. A21]|uniref:hypothetical protein n=1 Tax=Corynebacterium sp. A21 TaxID=3457318 RepID=UPI003FD1D859
MDNDKDLVLVEGAEGILAIGTEASLKMWQHSVGSGVQTRTPEGLDLTAFSQLLSLGQAVPSRFLPSLPGRTSAGTGSSGREPEIRRLVFGKDGRIQSSELLNPTLFLTLDPKLILVQAAIEVFAQSLAEIREELEEVKEGVQELLKQSEAARLGDIYGRNKVLRRVIQGLNLGESLSSADWDGLASMGPDLQIGTEKLRSYLEGSLRELDYEASPTKRVRQLQKFMESGRFVDHLKLLVVAEESLALYHRIRLERVRRTEPEAMDQTVRSIQLVLENNIDDDMSVAHQLSRMLSEFAVLRPAEGLDVRNRRRMDKLRAQLHDAAREFVRHRAGQAEDWSLAESARVKDAFNHYLGVLNGARRKTLQATADGLSSIAKKIEPRREEPVEGE